MLDEAKFTNAVMSKVAKVEANTIRGWMQRGHVPRWSTDKEAPKNGLARMVSGRTVILLAIMKALTNLGVEPRRAGEAAVTFCHTGQPRVSFNGIELEPELPERSDCELFSAPAQETVLIVSPEKSLVLPILPGETFSQIVEKIPGGFSEGATILPLSNIVNNTRLELGLLPDPWRPSN